MSVRIQLRRDTAANWTSTNPTLTQGEPGYETDTGKIKYGDGATAWNSLAYAPAAAVVDGTIVDADINAAAAISLSKLATGALPTAITVASSNIVDGTIVNADVNASAAIAGTKISPDFGSQNRTSTGTSTAASFIPTSSTVPTNGVYLPAANNVAISTNGTQRLLIGDTGVLEYYGGPYRFFRYGSLSANIVGRVAAGTQASPTAVTGNAGALGLFGDAYDGSIYRSVGGISIITDGAITGTSSPGYITFSTTPSGSVTPLERLRITAAGLVGIGTSAPATALQVNGDIRTSGVAGTGYELNDANTKISIPAANSIAFSTSGVERIRINNTGNVGIGTTSPAAPLHVAGTVRVGAADTSDANLQIGNGLSGNRASYLDLTGDTTYSSYGLRVLRNNSGANASSQILHRGTGNLDILTQEVAPIIFGINNSERARIDSSGRLLVGTSSAFTGLFGGNNSLYINGPNGQCISYFANSSVGPRFDFLRSRNATTGVQTVMQSGDELGSIYWGGSDGSAFIPAAFIRADVDGTPGTNDMPGCLVFSTTADGASSPTERMRITSGADVLIGKQTADNTTSGLRLAPDFASFVRNGNVPLILNRLNSDGSIATFRRSGVDVGTISVTTTATAYNTSSDYRLKENVTPVTDGITRLQQLKPSRFNFIADPAKTVDGFIAHEVQTIVPEAITGEKDAVDDEGNPQYQGIDQSKLVPLLTAALQEAIGEIESLKARVAALESA